MKRPLCFVIASILLSGTASKSSGQSVSSHPAVSSEPSQASASGKTTQTLSATETATPVTMTECEGVNNCATWTFLGSQGNGKWPSGNEANLTVERFDANSVVIRRADSTGASAGLKATYTGTRHGKNLGGEVTTNWPGHINNASGNWYATIESTPEGLPINMRMCANKCNTLTWKADHYEVLRDGEAAPWGTIKVVQWGPESIRLFIRAKQPGSDGKYAEGNITGKISPAGNSIVEGRMAEYNLNVSLSWGTAASGASAPSQQPPQTTALVRPVAVCFPWFFGIVCD